MSRIAVALNPPTRTEVRVFFLTRWVPGVCGRGRRPRAYSNNLLAELASGVSLSSSRPHRILQPLHGICITESGLQHGREKGVCRECGGSSAYHKKRKGTCREDEACSCQACLVVLMAGLRKDPTRDPDHPFKGIVSSNKRRPGANTGLGSEN